MHQVLQQREDPLLRLEKAASSLLLQGTRLYVGTSDGSLSCFKVSENQQSAELQHSKSDVSGGKSIAQLAFIKELSSLVVLADGNVSLLDAQTFALQSSLQAQCKSQASHFTLHTHVRPASDEQPAAIVSCLVVSAKRRLLLFRWTEAEWQQPGELSLPHQARSITFMTPSTLVLGFSDGSYSKLSIRDFTQLQLAEFPIADMLKSSSSAPVSSSSAGFTSLAFKTGGYIGLGSKVAKNQVLSASKGELFVCKEKHALLLPADGPSQELHFEVEPDHILLTPPFIIASFTSSRRLSVYSATTMELVQDFIPSAALDIVSTAAALRMPVLAASGFNIYLFPMVSYPDQLTSLLSSGHYAAALTLVNAIEDSVLPDRIFRLRTVKSLVALQQLLSGAGDAAIDAFIDLDINPAKIVGLWDARISGKLYLGDAAEETFGGRKKSEVERLEAEEAHNQSEEAVAPENDTSDTASIRSAASSLWRHSSRTPIATSPYRGKHDRQTSTSSLQGGLLQDAAKKEMQTFKDSVEVLLRYLADRRQKVNKALAALPESERPGTADDVPNANSDELLALPDAPLTSLSSAELRKVAQVVDTALFKCYLLVRPTLLGPLCRLDNWCKAEEVEGLLLSAKRYRELLDLFSGKGLHDKAIHLLKRISEEDSDASNAEKVRPAVTYLQKLGPRHLDLICDVSKWIFEMDEASGVELFTADLEEVESLPRHAVIEHLNHIGSRPLRIYLEHVINELGESGPECHERLAELYLEATQKADATDVSDDSHHRLNSFLEKSKQYRADRLLSKTPINLLPESRAILLGRLGQHEKALEIYVHRLKDYVSAEEHCINHQDAENIFLTLLKLYLQPRDPKAEPLFAPALELMARQSRHLAASAVMDLLPPLFSVSDVERYFVGATKRQAAAKVSTLFQREVYRARLDQLQRASVLVEEQHVKVTDATLCPGCHKRIGNSVIAVHQPHGEVTHYRCSLSPTRKT